MLMSGPCSPAVSSCGKLVRQAERHGVPAVESRPDVERLVLVGQQIGIGRQPHAVGVLGAVRIPMRRRVVPVVHHPLHTRVVGVDRRRPVRQPRLVGAHGVQPRDDRHAVPLRHLDKLAQQRRLSRKIPADRHGDDRVHQSLADPRRDVVPNLEVAFQRGRHANCYPLAAPLRLCRRVCRPPHVPHPLRQRLRVLLHLATGNQGRVRVEVQLDAVRRIVGHQLPDDCQPVLPNLRHGVRHPVRVVVYRLGVVRLLAHGPLRVEGVERGDPPVRDAVRRRVGHVQQQVRQEVEPALVGVVADDLQRIVPALDHHPAVERRLVPHLVIDEVVVVAPDLPHLRVVQQDRAVPHDVADRVHPQVEHLVDGLHVLPYPHRRLVQVHARMPPVRLENDLVLLGHFSPSLLTVWSSLPYPVITLKITAVPPPHRHSCPKPSFLRRQESSSRSLQSALCGSEVSVIFIFGGLGDNRRERLLRK